MISVKNYKQFSKSEFTSVSEIKLNMRGREKNVFSLLSGGH